ncbi:NTE family protein [Caloramator quimbayensis]|uniref:NTE family protein n=1 Tax=Caloramator quimbayensis TaxID=1147123 RepID=A0A1T4XT69_9CLOT|nr:patatin-like phospholipase family protein [Caloramator quimbayensis]SKA92295.1 NTE family protein [Caloramator quimbayensis]
MKDRFKIGLALGSGAARGLAHIGVIETLLKYDIPIDMVSGSSAGALIGSLYCAGIDFKYVKALFKELPKKAYLDVVVPRNGFIKGDKIQSILKFITKDCDFKDLKTPLYVVATDLKNKNIVIFKDGKVHEAIRASISVPGVFVPYFKDDMILVDGGVIERVPAKILKCMGADLVIGVDVGFNLNSSNCKSIFNVLYESIDLMERELFLMKKQDADIMIRVDLNDIDPTRFDLVDLCTEKGEQATLEVLDVIREKINEKLKNTSNETKLLQEEL